MANGTFGVDHQDSSERNSEASRVDRIALTLFGLLATYSVVYLFVLAVRFQV